MKQGILALLSAIVVATSGLSAQETEIPAVMTKKEMRRTMRGYKAFYEIGYDFDSRAAGERFADVSKFETVFVQGFQFNNYFFLGGGAGLNFFTGKTLEALAIPCFVDMRVNLLNKAVTPFFDARVGFAFGEVSVGNFNFQVGLRYGLAQNHAVFAAFGFGWQTEPDDMYDYGEDGEAFRAEPQDLVSYLGFKLGFEF